MAVERIHRTDTSSDRWLFLLFLLLLVWLPIPLGSNRPWASGLAAVWVFGLALWWILLFLQHKVQFTPAFVKARFVILLLGVYLVLSVIQVLPLPVGVSQLGHSLFSNSIISYVPDVQGLSTLSFDTFATWNFLLRSATYTAIFCLSVLLLNTRERLNRLFRWLIIVGVAQALFGAFMVMTGAEYSFFFEKEAYRGVATGTFVNRNHLAGHFEMVLALGVGWLLGQQKSTVTLSWRQRIRNTADWLLSPKMRVRIYLAIMVIGLVMTRSRMGNTAFFSSLLVASLVWILFVRKGRKGPALILLGSLFLIDVYILGAWFGIDKVVQRLESTSIATERRDEVVQYGLEYLQAVPVFGSGGGSFYSVFQGFRGSDVQSLYDHAHNDYLQFATETGLVGFSLLALVVLLSLWTALNALLTRRSQFFRGVAFSSLMGVLAILIHSTVDFNLQIPANAAYFMVLLSLAWIGKMMPVKSSGS